MILVCVQGAFGAWTVTLKLQPVIVTIHLMLGLTLLAALTYLSSLSARLDSHADLRAVKTDVPFKKIAWIVLAILILQIFLGGWVSTNYAVLALIIEKVTGMKFPEAMKEMIFTPLGMTNTYVCDFKKDHENIVPSYKGNNVEIGTDYLDGVYGDKNIYSTPRDLLKFDTARFAPFFLNPELLKKVYKGYSYESKGQKNYGLGIRMVEFEEGEPFFFHNGWWHGNTSSFINLRKEKVTIITLSNKYTKKTYQSKKLASLFGDYPFKLNETDE